MKKIFVASVITLLAFCGSALAADKANQGSCVSDCVQAFNKSLDDKGIDAEKVDTFTQKKCVEWCKNNPGQPYFWEKSVEPTGEPTGEPVLKLSGMICELGSDCLSGWCVKAPGAPIGQCK